MKVYFLDKKHIFYSFINTDGLSNKFHSYVQNCCNQKKDRKIGGTLYYLLLILNFCNNLPSTPNRNGFSFRNKI